MEAEEGLNMYRRDRRRIEGQLAYILRVALNFRERENQDALRETDDENETHDGPGQGTCVICLNDLSDHDAHRSPCGHDWCRTCIVNRYEMAAKSAHLFPAQCCNQLILTDNNALIAPETWARYFKKKIEVETPNPTFCSKRDCSKFIPPQHINKGQARCICGHITCTRCKAEWHTGECAVDPEVEQVLKLAQKEKWQTCFHCKEMVDRRDGCNELRMYSTIIISGIILEPLLMINQQDADVATPSAMHVASSGRHVPAPNLDAPSLLNSRLPSVCVPLWIGMQS